MERVEENKKSVKYVLTGKEFMERLGIDAKYVYLVDISAFDKVEIYVHE